MKALVFEDKGEQKVVDLSEKEFPVHSDLTWMDAPDGCEVGWLLKTGKLRGVCPPLPVVTPPTILVPYLIISFAWKEPNLPVKP